MAPRGFQDWDELYRSGGIEQLPWYWPSLDSDFDAALARHGVNTGSVLDQGTGPGTQAIALAERGFRVTATDISQAAVDYASAKARGRGMTITFVRDDVTASRLVGPFDAVFDRGCFHVLSPAQRDGYVGTMHRLVAPAGWLFLKTFSHRQPGTDGPNRFTPEEIRQIFGSRFDVIDIVDSEFQGQLEPRPKALFCELRRR